MLTGEETRLALLEPASAHGVAWSKDALDVVATAAGGYPYFVQVGGERAWRSAHGAATIELVAGEAGATAIAERADQMFRDRWKRLGPAQQRYLAAAADKDARRVRPGRAHGRDRGGARQAPDPAITSQSKPDQRASSTARRRLRARRVRIPPLRGLAASAAGASGDASDAREAVNLAKIAKPRPASRSLKPSPEPGEDRQARRLPSQRAPNRMARRHR